MKKQLASHFTDFKRTNQVSTDALIEPRKCVRIKIEKFGRKFSNFCKKKLIRSQL